MKKKIDDEQMGQIIGGLADELRRQMKYDFDIAYRDMCFAENVLVNSLDQNQRELYKDFYLKRDAFYNIASEIYQKKYW